jgi:NAD(P)-dependent dehydrogenase (short-subunit alcohol dehydrogenase family)
VASLPPSGAHRSVAGDLTEPAVVDEVFGTIAADDASAPLGVVVNNVGTYPSASLERMTIDDWRRVLRVNLDATLLCTQAAARRMRTSGGGAVVNIASLSAHRPATEQSHYDAAKAGVVTFTRAAAVELGPVGIRVNSVSPGLVHRPGIEQDWLDGVTRWQDRVPLGRLVAPSDVADACVFLASPLAAGITGQDLLVDGGISATPAY